MRAVPLAQVNRYLLRKQHLAPEWQGDDVLQVVQDISALHATGAPNPYLSLWSRVRGFDYRQLDRQLYETRQLVRKLCMRSTVHIVPSARLPIVFQATLDRLNRRVERDMDKLLVWAGLCEEGEQAELLESLERRIVGALSAHGTATQSELSESVPELKAQVDYAPGKPYGGKYGVGTRLISGLCVRGLLVRARPRGSWRSSLYEYALLSEWLPDVDLRATTAPAARAQLLRWYLAAFGPATFEDIVWWSGFSKTETRKALAALRSELAEIEVQALGSDFLMLNEDRQELLNSEPSADPCVSLLPALDPYVMGYQERLRFLEGEHRDQVFDRSGNAFATVWVNGHITGVWLEGERGLEVLVWDDAERERLLTAAQGLAGFISQADGGQLALEQMGVKVKQYPRHVKVRNPFRLTRR
jgi:hypothetical protein